MRQAELSISEIMYVYQPPTNCDLLGLEAGDVHGLLIAAGRAEQHLVAGGVAVGSCSRGGRANGKTDMAAQVLLVGDLSEGYVWGVKAFGRHWL
jgi:hypothetical protein